MRPDSRTRTQPVVLALVTDIVCVVVFCTAGARSPFSSASSNPKLLSVS